MKSMFNLDLNLSEDAKSTVLSRPESLREACKDEVARFATYVNAVDPQFRRCPLAKEERVAIEGYLYQKIRGHIEQFHDQKMPI